MTYYYENRVQYHYGSERYRDQDWDYLFSKSFQFLCVDLYKVKTAHNLMMIMKKELLYEEYKIIKWWHSWFNKSYNRNSCGKALIIWNDMWVKKWSCRNHFVFIYCDRYVCVCGCVYMCVCVWVRVYVCPNVPSGTRFSHYCIVVLLLNTSSWFLENF